MCFDFSDGWSGLLPNWDSSVVERILSAVIDIALPNERDKHHDHPSSDSNQYALSGSQLGTPMADLTIKAGVAQIDS
jgi:hypothetical protein